MYDMKNGVIWFISFLDIKYKPTVAFLKSLSVNAQLTSTLKKERKKAPNNWYVFFDRHIK